MKGQEEREPERRKQVAAEVKAKEKPKKKGLLEKKLLEKKARPMQILTKSATGSNPPIGGVA